LSLSLLNAILQIAETITKIFEGKFHYIFSSSAARGVVILFPTLGLSWGFSVIAAKHDAVVWKYLFAIFTSLQVRE
jgi:hypothetical protein